MTLWDRIVSLFRSAPAPRPPRPQVQGCVVWGDIDDPASPVLETPAPEPGEVRVLIEEPAIISVPLPDIDKVKEFLSRKKPPSTQELNELLWRDKTSPFRS